MWSWARIWTSRCVFRGSALPCGSPFPLIGRCTSCDFKVVRFQDAKWKPHCDYLFFRNYRTNIQKLQAVSPSISPTEPAGHRGLRGVLLPVQVAEYNKMYGVVRVEATKIIKVGLRRACGMNYTFVLFRDVMLCVIGKRNL
jgi:hypothetical protein